MKRIDDNLEEYADPALYDYEHKDFEPYGPFYLALAERIGGTILDIGCGTGRVTIPLARHGFSITGIDIVPAMLEFAERKAPELSIDWVKADARTFQLNKKFDLIIEPGSAFQHMLESIDQQAMLERVRDHLAPEGILVLCLVFPRPNMMVTSESEQEWFSYLNEQGQKIRVSGTDHYDHLKQIKTETAYRRWHETNGQEVVRQATLRQRFTFPQEMESLLTYCGFIISQRYGDWDFTPLTNESNYMIYLCKARK